MEQLEQLRQLEQLAVEKYKQTTLSLAAVARFYGVEKNQVKYWLKKHKVKPRLGYTPNTEKRKQAAKDYLDGVSVAEICKKVNRCSTVVYKWLRLEGVRD